MDTHYPVIVVGGGHAGTEAAVAAARSGAKTLLLTQNIETIGQMSCNPAIGGIGKSHLVKEVDALGGVMGLATDSAGIQFRRLNSSRGAAVQATRAQCDRHLYKQAILGLLRAIPGLTIRQQTVSGFVLSGDAIRGVRCADGSVVRADAVVLTTGTFLNGIMHIGDEQTAGGRAGCPAVTELTAQLAALSLPLGRLKTGTPPRLDGKTIDFDKLEAQAGDSPAPVMSFIGNPQNHPPQRPCFISRTTQSTHDIIHQALHQSPMFGGGIESPGPRYCPSIEDKVHRFAERDSHRVFLEPEGLTTDEYYPNGLSTGLPRKVQEAFVRTVPGLEKARITQFGYAIEYDYVDPRALTPDLRVQATDNLFFAGQINGTTGYEEAAAQGLIAGLNASRLAHGHAPWVPAREEAYIGVLIDDLTSRGVNEPYRMFTSRAEYRLSLREGNADLRLTPAGRALGLVDEPRWQIFCQRRRRLEEEETRLQASRAATLIAGASKHLSAAEWLRRGDAFYRDLATEARLTEPSDIAELEARIKYAGYIAHQEKQLRRERQEESLSIPERFDFASVPGLSHEVSEVLNKHQPATIRQARRISGVTPAAISLLAARLKRRSDENLRRS